MQGVFVIDRDLFARRNIAQGKEQHLSVKRLYESVGRARVINVMSAVSAAAAVQAPASINVADAQDATTAGSSGCFPIRNPLAGVFSDLFPARERDGRKTSFAVDW